MSSSLTARSRNWATIDVKHVGARGQLSPRLLLTCESRTPTERIETVLHHLVVTAHCRDEVLGEAVVAGEDIGWSGRHLQIEIPTTHRLLQHVTEPLVSGDAAVGLRLSFRGVLRVRWQPGEGDGRMVGDPEADTWEWLSVSGNASEHHVNVARSDWYENVVKPTGGSDYIHLEVAIPRTAERDGWLNSVRHLAAAEKALALGDDPGVFAKLRAAFEALPGANLHIFDALPEAKRAETDELVRSFVTYLHHGRHVARDGEQAGAFAVDGMDARFALNLAKVVLSYSSLELARWCDS